jgi:WD40 repeat protein/transcriptional regulator with XRE-family HTH domain
MKRRNYGERDYAFGQAMQALRTSIGLTQAGLADLLGVSRRAVAEWEAGSSYPKAAHLKQLIALGVQQWAFAAGSEAGEIRAFWQAAHQKMQLDETWLSALLSQRGSPPPLTASVPAEQPGVTGRVTAPPVRGQRVDWKDALVVPTFYGRKEELAELTRWVLEDRCRVVSVLGMGGIGKSALAVSLMRQVAEHFQVVLWRSLRDAPPPEALLEDCLQVLAPEPLASVPDGLERRLGLLLGYLREQRALIVLDNLEVLLAEGEGTGRMRPGYEGYARLLRQVAQTWHQSCLLLTSREKPGELVSLEGSHTLVRSLRLEGLERTAGEQLLGERELVGSLSERARLIDRYAGNPLALKIVAETIVELFGGEIAAFLEQDETLVGSVGELLGEQFKRLSTVEQTVLLWLAILREPVGIEELLALLSAPLPRVQVLEAVEALRRRSLIERGHRRGSFTLQSLVLEYVTAQLISEVVSEIEQGDLSPPSRLIEHGLTLATVPVYVRQTQQRLIVAPILASLRIAYPQRAALEERILALLDQLRTQADYTQGYGPSNLLALLLLQRGHLRGLDLSRLAFRGVYLQGTDMRDTTLSHSVIQDSVFTERLDVSLRVAISSTGAYWVAGSRGGEIWVWEAGGLILRQAWRAHTDMVWALTFSPDGRTLASGSSGGSVKLWEIASGTLLWAAWLTRSITWLAFSPGGGRLASGGFDAFVRLWDPKLGTPLKELPHPSSVCSLAWSPDEQVLASGCSDGSIWLWELEGSEPGPCARRLSGHTQWVAGLAFAPDGVLASGSYDGTVKLWDTTSASCLQTFSGHADRVIRVLWSPDGRTLASCSVDHTIRFWDVAEGRARMVLQGHTDVVPSLVFTPDSRTLLSGSNDGTVRVWDVASGQCLRIIGGYAAPLLDIDWSPDGTRLSSGGADTLVMLWEGVGTTSPRVLHGHRDIVQGVAWSPDGQLLASGGHDGIGLWDPASGVRLAVLQDPETANTVFQGVAWSPDGRLLAGGSYLRGVQVWDITTRTRRWVGETEPTRIRRVAWSPDGTQLAGGGDDGSVYMWDATGGTRLWRLTEHQGAVTSVAWSPDGTRLASAGGREDGELFVWDAHSGERLCALAGLAGIISTVAWEPSGDRLIGGGSDGRLRWWDLRHGECVREREAHQGTVQALKASPDGSLLASCGDDGAIQIWDLEHGEHLRTLRRDRPYERLNITGIRGLTAAQKLTLRELGAIEDPPF